MLTILLRFFAVVLLLAVSLVAHGQERPFYAVTFGITIDASGKLIGFHPVAVIDPLSGNTQKLDVKLPTQYISAARQLVLSKHYKPQQENGKPKEFFTWFFYVPSQPRRADLDPTKANDP
jgi:hypothetical protein